MLNDANSIRKLLFCACLPCSAHLAVNGSCCSEIVKLQVLSRLTILHHLPITRTTQHLLFQQWVKDLSHQHCEGLCKCITYLFMFQLYLCIGTLGTTGVAGFVC